MEGTRGTWRATKMNCFGKYVKKFRFGHWIVAILDKMHTGQCKVQSSDISHWEKMRLVRTVSLETIPTSNATMQPAWALFAFVSLLCLYFATPLFYASNNTVRHKRHCNVLLKKKRQLWWVRTETICHGFSFHIGGLTCHIYMSYSILIVMSAKQISFVSSLW